MTARRTPLTGAQAASSLSEAWQRIHGAAPSPALLRTMVAQWAHETGHGGAMLNYNFGGIKGTGPEGMTVTCRTREGSGADERVIRDRFRAYASATDGAEDYVRVLSGRYAEALAEAERGDPSAFVAALKRKGYFTGSEQAYIRSVERLASAIENAGFGAVGGGAGAPLTMSNVPIANNAPAGGTRELSGSGFAPSDEMLSALALSFAASFDGEVARILSTPESAQHE